MGLEFVRLPVHEPKDYAPAFEKAAGANCKALFVMDDGAITKNRQEILELATKYRLPVVSIYRDFAKSGGLIAYGPNLDIVYRRAAHFVDKLIKGERASDLPVEQPVKNVKHVDELIALHELEHLPRHIFSDVGSRENKLTVLHRDLAISQ